MRSEDLNERILGLIARKEALGLLPPRAGIAVSVQQGNEVVFTGTYGLRDRERNLPVTPETVFGICSLTKAFTATALMIASERGLVDLERPINSSKELLALGDPEVSRSVSIADILAHRTGLPSYDLLWYLGSLGREELLKALARLELAPGAFRKSFTYNSLLYGALGHLFASLAGESWEQFVSRNLLGPLKMTSTSFGGSIAEQNVALPYVGTQRAKSPDMSAVAAGGAMESNLHDVARWIAFHLAGGKTPGGEELLSRSAIDRLQSRQIAMQGANPLLFHGWEWLSKEAAYGFGWILGAAGDLKVAFHPGFIDGFSTAAALIPEKKLGFVVLTNVDSSDTPGHLVQELTALLTERERPAPKEVPEIGDYENPGFGRLSVVSRGGRLGLKYKENDWPLLRRAEGAFEFVVVVGGMRIPLPLRFEHENGRTHQLSIPFSLDPRVAPQVFTRTS